MWPVYGGSIIMERVYVCFGDTHTDLKRLKKKRTRTVSVPMCDLCVCVYVCVFMCMCFLGAVTQQIA